MTKENLPRIGSRVTIWLKSGRGEQGVFDRLTPDETALVISLQLPWASKPHAELIVQLDCIEGYWQDVNTKETS